ncbi:glucuronoxylanase [Glycomyces paridis]|uniref:Glucuronoxylanase n=1 Tax=Glycomyces paridis TaxID=2126555 RepID=A0A4S8PHL3_9ACTN|nr:cellulose binding domain-containing protein [Glycomyces paridis]THV29451.1 glucuronoxylanase [Glycomyces paridis]
MTSRDNRTGSATKRSISRRSLLAAGAIPVIAVAAPATAQSGVTVNPAASRQTIRGFGAMNHTVWIADLTAAQRETAFGNGANQLGFTMLRIPVHEDRANWSREVATAKRASELGALVFASPWNPPASMTETFSGGKRLRYDQYGAYAAHLNDFYEFMGDNGVDLHAVSVQNEPDYAHDWTAWTSAEIVRFLRENTAAIGTKVIAPESFQYRKVLSDPILNDAQALANTDILGAHLYGTQPADFPYPLYQQKGAGKELWMTEVYYPNSSDSADLWPQALDVGEHMHRALVDGQFQAYVWWYLRRSYGPMREDGQISKRGANMAHFAKFVRPGYVRVDATATPQSNVYTSAYRGPDGRVVVVAVNKSGSAVNLPVTIQGSTATSVSSWRTSSAGNLVAQNPIAVSGGAFTASLPAQSITTFVTGEGSVDPDPDPEPGGSCQGRVEVVGDWGSGWQGKVSVTAGEEAVDGWNLNWTWPGGQQITSAWNADWSQTGSAVSASDIGWNARIEAGQTREVFGFVASGPATALDLSC